MSKPILITRRKLANFFQSRRHSNLAPRSDLIREAVTAAERTELTNLIPAAVLIPIIDQRDGLTILFTQRTSHLKNHPGQISFPGGSTAKEDADRIATALRETKEEIGLEASQIKILGELTQLYTSTGFLISPIVGLITPPFQLELDCFEVTETFEVPINFLLDPQNRQRHSIMIADKEKQFYSITYQNKQIWGVTAAILVNLAESLEISL